MSEAVAAAARKRGERRKARTRAALVAAAQRLIAEDRTDVPILEITELADVGMGSFYNHFDKKDQLFDAAIEDALERQGRVLDAWSTDDEDPARVFARSFRLVGRMHRVEPRLSRVLLARGPTLLHAEQGLGPRALRDVQRGCEAGRFTVADPGAALLVIGGAALTMAQSIHDRPDRDDARLTDDVATYLLRMLGVPADEAAEICNEPLPSVVDLVQRARDSTGAL